MQTLNLIEIYSSVQGETTFVGLPTTFIRTAACNLRCSWCDTTYSFGKGTPFHLQEILETVKSFGHPYICVTGGEPLLQKNSLILMSSLCDLGYTVNLETGGGCTIKEIDPRVHIILDIKCPGSGMEAKNIWENIPLLKTRDEVKFVILDETDYLFSKRIIEEQQLDKKCGQILFSPVHGRLDPKQLVEWILKDRLPVRLNLQIHKFIWSPTEKGV